MKVTLLPLEAIRPNPNQPRKTFAPAELEELAQSIATHGLLQPIRVSPQPEGIYLLVCGERRWRAYGVLGWPTIAAIVEPLTDEELADAAILENLQRVDVSPLEEAHAYAARLASGIAVEDLARRLGLKSAARIRQRLLLLNLLPQYQDALRLGVLYPVQAYEMGRLAPASQKVFYDAIRAGRCRDPEEMRRTAMALLAAERQGELFGERATKEDLAVVHRLGRTIERVAGMVCQGFDGNDVVILRKVNPLDADVLADKLALIEQACKKLRLALRAAKVVGAWAAERPQSVA